MSDATIEWEIVNLPELQAKLGPELIDAGADVLLQEVPQAVADSLRQVAPIGATGTLRRSFQVVSVDSEVTGITSVYYGSIINRGFRHFGGRYIPGQFFTDAAITAAKTRIDEALDSAGQAVTKEWSK